MNGIRILEGFANQHLYRLPRPILERWGNHPLLQSMMPTDIGWFPHARYHYCKRAAGAPEHILIFCVDGEGWFEVDGVTRPVYANQAFFIPQDMPHAYGSSEEAPWSIHWTHFVGAESGVYVNQVPEEEHRLLVDEACRIRLEQLFQQCYEVLQEGFVLNRLIHAAKILQHLFGEMFYNNLAFSPYQRTNRFRSIEPTLRYLRQNIDQSLTLTDIANHAGLSKPHFSRIFKNQTGYSPMDYFIHLKVQKASSLLVLTEMTVREIALVVGYGDPYYFSRLFKKVVGISPSAVRKQPH
ncbi:MAG: AraC family transcriptional regulator [Chloroflexi bacterium]|nr:MAG: AraC family transcriptional regulator [Chloroflexota bacterium]